jgi:hypothetical protein
VFRWRGGQRLEVDVDIFNAPNLARFQGFLVGAHRRDGVDFGKGGTVQPPRTVQLGLRFWF